MLKSNTSDSGLSRIYEVVDLTFESMPCPMAIFKTLEEAIDALSTPRPPGSHQHWRGRFYAVVYERTFGWSEEQTVVYSVEWRIKGYRPGERYAGDAQAHQQLEWDRFVLERR